MITAARQNRARMERLLPMCSDVQLTARIGGIQAADLRTERRGFSCSPPERKPFRRVERLKTRHEKHEIHETIISFSCLHRFWSFVSFVFFSFVSFVVRVLRPGGQG